MKTEQEARRVLAALEPALFGEELRRVPAGVLAGAIVDEDSILMWGGSRIWMLELSRELIDALKPIRTLQALRGESPNRRLSVMTKRPKFLPHPEGIAGLSFFIPQSALSRTTQMPLVLSEYSNGEELLVLLYGEGSYLRLDTRTGSYLVPRVPAS